MAKIVIVGERRDLCIAMTRMFHRDGHDAECIDSVDRVLDVLPQKAPDLVVLEMHGPDPAPLLGTLSGMRRHEQLRAVKAVVLADVKTPHWLGDAFGAGADGFVSWERARPDEVVNALEGWLQ